MKTDKQLFQIFSAMPEWLFDLTRLPSPGACEMRSFTVKELQRDPDSVFVPLDVQQPLTVAEFQFQWDENIYTRIVIEMAAVQEAHRQRPVQGVIIFGKPGLDPRTAPWTQVVRSVLLQDVLNDLRQRQPEHPLVHVLEPLLEPDDDTLESTAAGHYRALKECDLDNRRREVLLDVFVNWLEQRFQKKSKKEIETMLSPYELPDIRDTQSGRDLIAIGKLEGKAEGLAEAIVLIVKDRFRKVPKELEERLPQIPRRSKQHLLRLVTRADSVADIENWLKKNPLKQPTRR